MADEEEPVSEDEDSEQIPDAVPTTSRTRPADRETASASRSRYASRTSGPRRMHCESAFSVSVVFLC